MSYVALWKWGPAELHFSYFIIVCMTTSWADPAAAVIGKLAAEMEINLPWPILGNQNKTLPGSIGCLTVAMAVIGLGLMATGLPFPVIMRKIVAAGLLTTFGEALAGDQPWRKVRLDDNFVVPLGTTAGLLLF